MSLSSCFGAARTWLVNKNLSSMRRMSVSPLGPMRPPPNTIEHSGATSVSTCIRVRPLMVGETDQGTLQGFITTVIAALVQSCLAVSIQSQGDTGKQEHA